MSRSVSKYAVKEIKKLVGASEDLLQPIGIGGSATLSTKPHSLDGPEHIAATGTDRLLATETNSGLLLPLSGDPDDRLAGDGSWQPEDSGSGHDITEDGGSALTTRTKLDFRHGLDVSDDAGSNSTRVAVDESELTHNSLGGLTTGDPHTQYATQVEFDDHSARHESGGADAIKLDDLAAPDDNTDLDASTAKHGLLKKLPGGTTTYLRADGTFATPSGGSVATDTIWDAAGDLAVGSGADTAAKLTKGSDGQVLTVDPTTHLLVWATPKTVATDTIWDTKGDIAAATGADAASKLAVGTDGYVLTADSSQSTGLKWADPGYGGGGGSVYWNQHINESGASLANWTTLSGTWSSDGTIIKHTSVAGAWQKLKYNSPALIPYGFPTIAEWEMRFPTSGQGTGSFVQGGAAVGTVGILISKSANAILHQDIEVTEFRQIAFTVALDTWYKVRFVTSGAFVTTYIDGTLLDTSRLTGQVISDIFVLTGYNNKTDYRNIKLWTLSGGAPA